MKVIGDVPWAKMRYDTDVAKALMTTYDAFGIRYGTRQPPRRFWEATAGVSLHRRRPQHPDRWRRRGLRRQCACCQRVLRD